MILATLREIVANDPPRFVKKEVAKIPAAIACHKATSHEKQDAPRGNLLKNCCAAPAAFRAGLSVADSCRLFNIPCSQEQAQDCCECWQLMEKVELYNAQSAAAKAGDGGMLRHLGTAVLMQDGKSHVIDPGLGDLVFEVTGSESENRNRVEPETETSAK